MRARYQTYDIPANEEVNAGDVRTAANSSKWLVVSAVRHGDKLRLTTIPNTSANRKRIAHLEQC